MARSESIDGTSDGDGSRREGSSTAASSSQQNNKEGSNSNKKRKKNATMACNTCRRKRNRCIVDEGEGVCRGCKASGAECQFAEFDKRRDGIQELREKLSFYESMFERLKEGSSGSGSAGVGEAALSSSSSSSTARPPYDLDQAAAAATAQLLNSEQHIHQHHDRHHPNPHQHQQQRHDSFDFLANGFPTENSSSSSGHDADNTNGIHTSAASNSTASFFEPQQLHLQQQNGNIADSSGSSIGASLNTVTPQSSVRSKRPRESPRGENASAALPPSATPGAATSAVRETHSHHVHTQSNSSTTNGTNVTANGNSYEDQQHYQRQSSKERSSSVHHRMSGRTPDMSAVMDHLAVESNGLIRAYGATSSTALAGFEDLPNQKAAYSTRRYQSALNSKDPPREVTPPADVRPLQTSALVAAAANITALPLGTDIRTVQHLLHLYFLWAWPMFPVISRQIFMQHFSHGGQYYSPLLLNALLALASHLSDWKVVRAQADDPYTAGNTFFDMAKSLLEDELERPSVTTVQALCLMAKREAYCGRPLRGGLYIAMCGRLVLDLGLHLDCLHLLDRGILTDTDRYVRSVTFWGIWSVDKEYSAMVGRPCSIRNVVITCPKPGHWTLEDFDWWEAYRTGEISQIQVPLSEPWKGPGAVSRAALEMAGIHLKSMERLHWGENETSTIEHSRNLETSMTETRASMAQLPTPDAAVAQGLVPHAITLNMTYHCHIIIINRPFLFDDPEERASRPPSAAGGIEDTPRKRCFHSAQELIRLIDMFRSFTPSGIQPILNCHQHNVVIAAAILIFQVTSVTGTFMASYESRIANELLQRAMVILGEMAAHRPAARQALANLKNSFDQRRKREARLTQGPTLPTPQSAVPKSMNPFGYSPTFHNSDNNILDSYSSVPIDPALANANGHSESTFGGGQTVPSFGIMDSSLHAPLFYGNDGPLDDFSDLDSFLAQHSGYLYSADLLQSFPGGSA